MPLSFTPLILAFILSLVYVVSYRISDSIEKYHEYILSIGSGMLLAIIFVEVLPELIEEGNKFLSSDIIALSILIGFTSYHLIEKYTYKHSKRTLETTRIGYLHVGGFFIDNFLEGFVLVLIFSIATNYLIYILFIPLLLGDIAASTTLRHINDKFKLGKIGIILLSSSIFLGAVVGSLLRLNEKTFYITLGILTGIFIYFITRDEIPRGRKGKPLAFLIALIIISTIFLVIKGVI